MSFETTTKCSRLDTKIVVLTASVAADCLPHTELYKEAAYDVIKKPFKDSQIHKIMKKLLKK